MKKLGIIFLVLFLVGCATTVETTEESDEEYVCIDCEEGAEELEFEEAPEMIVEYDWRATELTDIRTGETFTINDFEGQKFFLESFAVWCPTCTKQQDNFKELRETSDVVIISLDTDANEDEETVRNHIYENDFDWYYAIAPIEMTDELVEEFGLRFISAPNVPTILICEDLSTRFLDSGRHSPEELQEEMDVGC